MHLFFDTVWKLHIGEIPEKPHEFIDEIEQYDIWEEYRNSFNFIKQNALIVANPEVIPVYFADEDTMVIKTNPNDPRYVLPYEFYEWYGTYQEKETEKIIDFEGSECYPIYETVAILTLPEDKTKNLTMKTEPIAIFNPKQISPESYTKAVKAALLEVGFEVERAKTLFPSMFINQHEAIAVIREEYLELEQECFKNQRDYSLELQRKEAKQLAAMAIRLMIELT